jgi:hypothetical protein
VTDRLCFEDTQSGRLITFSGVITLTGETISVIDETEARSTFFQKLVWDGDVLDHRCWGKPGVIAPSTECRPLHAAEVIILRKPSQPLLSVLFDGSVTFGPGIVGMTINPAQFAPKSYRFMVNRDLGIDQPVVFLNDSVDEPAIAPERGEIVLVASRRESGEEILAREFPETPDFPAFAPPFRHLICSKSGVFRCHEWLAGFTLSAAAARNWADGSSSTLELSCSQNSTRLGQDIGDYYSVGTEIETGALVYWTCLDFREVVVGGNAVASTDSGKLDSGVKAWVIITCSVVGAVVLGVAVGTVVAWRRRIFCFKREPGHIAP